MFVDVLQWSSVKLHHGLSRLQEFLLELRGLDPLKNKRGKWNFLNF